MSIDDNGLTSHREHSDQSNVTSLHKGASPPVDEQNITSRESAVVDDEIAVRDREKLASSREDAAHLRENAIGLREDAAHMRERTALAREREARVRESAVTLREQEICGPGPSSDHSIVLRQANEHLVIAAIESQKLVEIVQTAKMELDHLAHHDVLTDLPNRILLLDRLTQAIELARRQGKQLAVMFLDLDHFKYINDSLGHTVGDLLLQSIAHLLVACVRNSDTVSRQGGDEFVLLLPSIEHVNDAAHCAQKIITAFTLPHSIDQHNLHISVSIGVSIYPDDGLDAETLIKSADTAMYHAKEGGRENFKFFKQEMNDRAVQRQSVEASLRLALERQEFVLYYQPKVNLRSGAIVGCEALIRWQHPERGLLSPEQFVSIAEDCGLILPIGRWVLREACLQALAWRQAGLRPIVVAVNTSALELRAMDFLENIRATLVETSMEPRYLELELTESVLMQDAESSNSALLALHDLGAKLALDDFGTGYSSLSYLRRFPIDTLKIDQSFVNHITSNKDDATIVCSVVSLGKSLNKRVIAEGVETQEQYEFLLAQECDEGQGFYLSRPVVAAALAALLQSGVSLPVYDGAA
ncbi:putative bifunctional diguanylate cyclase/phosphodiesterase [Solimicrobium silvestre]|uniref:GGDEF: diguanylate cyclase (GGDEF) domain n=1 Tax=Solimicrobium silvestre TaxID=2099400 RepID=A0A2S9GXK3_9BURK|nr:EAL domain-containing protein [Solimicrobium silvestre]PRC92457.1 GGDEF: diguanylate cyclase (GGDEF) domain [Solimicrobium silvestre]